MSDDVNAAVEAFNAHLDQLAEEAGVDLDHAERQRIFGESVAAGFSPESTHEAFGAFVEEEYEGRRLRRRRRVRGAGRRGAGDLTRVSCVTSATTSNGSPLSTGVRSPVARRRSSPVAHSSRPNGGARSTLRRL
jgi:hypothetical protein